MNFQQSRDQILQLTILIYIISQKLLNAQTQNCIVINELVWKPLNGEDWIELYNKCSQKITIRGYYLHDSSPKNQLKFGNDAENCTHEIEGHDYLLLRRKQECSFDFGLSQKDHLHLFNSLGNEVDNTSWGEGDGLLGKSWARLPNGVGDFRSAYPTAGKPNLEWQILDRTVITNVKDVTIVINEVVAKPQEPETDWIELYNYGVTPIDLTGFWLTDEKDNRFTFGEAGCEEQAIIRPGRFLVIERSRSDQMGSLSNCQFDFGLGESDQVSLWLTKKLRVDSASYGPDYNNTAVPQGVSWGRLPDGPSGGFITQIPSKARKNEMAVVGDQLVQFMRAAFQANRC